MQTAIRHTVTRNHHKGMRVFHQANERLIVRRQGEASMLAHVTISAQLTLFVR